MPRAWVVLIGVVVASGAVVASCDGSGRGNSPSVTSCQAYCDAVIGAACEVPIYSSARTCKAYECSSLDSSSEPCQKASKAYYDCAAAQTDLCANAGCVRQLDAALNCGAGGRRGTGGRGGAGGRGAAGGRGGAGAIGGGGGIAGFGGASGGGGWSPAVFGQRLVVWLDASTETAYPHGAQIGLWTDRSGYGNHARAPTAPFPPVFLVGAINGRPAVNFNPGDVSFVIDDAPSLQFGPEDFVVMVVARAELTNAANAVLVSKLETMSPFRGLTLYLNASRPDPSFKPAMRIDNMSFARAMNNYGDTAPHVFGGRQVGLGRNVLEIRVDGAAEGEVGAARIDISARGSSVVIGNYRATTASGFGRFVGDIAEVVMIRGTVDDAELSALEAYLISKYGLL